MWNRNVTTFPRRNFNGGLTKPSFELGHGVKGSVNNASNPGGRKWNLTVTGYNNLLEHKKITDIINFDMANLVRNLQKKVVNLTWFIG